MKKTRCWTLIFTLILPLIVWAQEPLLNQSVTLAVAPPVGASALPELPATTPLSEADFFAIVNQTGGYINPSLHHAFWERMASQYTPDQCGHMVADIQQSLDILKAFQIQFWESAKISYFTKQMRLTTAYTPLKAQLLGLRSPYFSPATLVSNAEKIIAAAADRQAIDLGAGKYYVTPELIEENLIGIQGSYERLKLLMTPEWKAEYKEYQLPKMPVTLLSLYAPDEYEENVSHEDEKLSLHFAQLSNDAEVLHEIGAVDYQKGNKRFMHFTRQEREAYLHAFVLEQFEGYRVTAPQMSKGLWRGHPYVKGMALFEDHYVILMCFFVGDKAIYVKHVTDADLSHATMQFNDLTKRIQIQEPKTATGGSPLRTYTRVTS